MLSTAFIQLVSIRCLSCSSISLSPVFNRADSLGIAKDIYISFQSYTILQLINNVINFFNITHGTAIAVTDLTCWPFSGGF